MVIVKSAWSPYSDLLQQMCYNSSPLQGIIGVLYRQAACVLVDSVLFQLTVFFSMFGMVIHYYNRQERHSDLACSPALSQLCPAMSYTGGWSQVLGLLSIFFASGTAVGLYGLSRLIISRLY